MDVTCERCGTEYEFDETLVSDRGTTVKCTNCGHLFKVFRPDAKGKDDRSWTVQRQDGSTETLGSLRELQQRITRGQVSEDDEISRSGGAWKRLGDIAELQTFFRAAAAAATATETLRDAPAQKKKSTILGMGGLSSAPPPAPPPKPRPPTSRPPTPPATPSQRPPTPPRPSVPAPVRPAAATHRVAPPAPASAPPPPPRAPAATAPGPSLEARSEPPPRPKRGDPTERTHQGRKKKKALYIDDDDHAPVQSTGVGGKVAIAVLLLLLVGIGAFVAVQWEHLAPLVGLGNSDKVAEFVNAGSDALALDTEEGYQTAIREFTRGTAHDESDPRLLLGLSKAHAALAQALSFHASDLEARAGDDASLRGEAARVRRDAESHGEEAWRFADQAVAQAPTDGLAEVALADALRLTGDKDRAQVHLDRAQELFDDPPAEFHLARALLGAHGQPIGAAIPGLQEAVRADSELVRARLALARAHLSGQDVSAARAELQSVLSVHGDHPYARELGDAIDQGLPPAAPVVAIGDAGSVDAGIDASSEEPPEPDSVEPPSEQTSNSSSAMGSGGSGAPPRGRDYSFYIRRGEDLLEHGRTAEAQEFFEAALTVRPGGVEAMTGLGYAALNRGQAAAAAHYFRPAARADYGDAHIGLGDAYRRMNQLDQARAAYQAYLNSRPSGPHASIARRQIAAIDARQAARPDEPAETAPPANDPTSSAMGAAPSTPGTPEEGAQDAPPAPTPAPPAGAPAAAMGEPPAAMEPSAPDPG